MIHALNPSLSLSFSLSRGRRMGDKVPLLLFSTTGFRFRIPESISCSLYMFESPAREPYQGDPNYARARRHTLVLSHAEHLMLNYN